MSHMDTSIRDWYWVGQAHATGDHNFGHWNANHGDKEFVTIKNCWNNKDNWMMGFPCNSGEPEHYCGDGDPTGGAGGGGNDCKHYVPATGYPGADGNFSPRVYFKQLPHNPNRGLCNGPYPKSECLYGGSGTGGAYGLDGSVVGTSVTGRSQMSRIEVDHSYFDANLFPNLAKPCTGAPLERLRLGMELPYPIKTTHLGYGNSQAPWATGTDNPTGNYAGEGYWFKGLNLRSGTTISIRMQNKIRDINRDQTQCILADPQNFAGNSWYVEGQGDFYANASRYLSGGPGVPPLFEGPNGGHNLRGNGTLNLFVEPYEYGELSNMGWVGPNAKSGCSYNKSMTCKWIGTIRSKVLVQGGSVERVLIAPSASFDQRYIVDGGTGPTGPMGLHKPHMLEFSCNNVYLGEVPEWDGVSVPAEDRRPVETQFWSEYTRTWQQRNDCAVKGVYPFHITARDDNGNTGGIFGAIQNRQRTSNTEWFAGSADTIERHGVKFYSEGEVHLTGSDFDMTLFDRVDIIDNLEIESGKFDLGVINSQVFVRGGSIKYGGQINMDFTGQGEIEIMGMMTGGNSYQWRKSPSYPYSIVTGNATGASEEGVLMLQDEDNPGIIGIPKGSYLAFRGPTGSNVAGATRSGGRGPTIDLQGGGK